jgi:hypothetical protein
MTATLTLTANSSFLVPCTHGQDSAAGQAADSRTRPAPSFPSQHADILIRAGFSRTRTSSVRQATRLVGGCHPRAPPPTWHNTLKPTKTSQAGGLSARARDWAYAIIPDP